MAFFELFVLAEILWYYLHDGDQTLHEAFAEWWAGFKSRVRYGTSIAHTRGMIRDLPETK